MANVITCPFPEDGPESLTEQVNTFPTRSKSGVYGKARWASQAVLRSITSPLTRSHTPAFENVIPIIEDPRTRRLKTGPNSDLYFPDAMQCSHLCVFGNTGAGKTQNVINGILCDHIANRNVTVVAIVAKLETTELARTVVENYRPEDELIVLNFGNRHRSTYAFQPVVNSQTKHDPGLILASVTDLINASQDNARLRDFFWTTSAARMITGCILRGIERFGDFNLADVHHVLELPMPKLIEFLETGPQLEFANASAHTIKNDGHNANTTLAFAQSYLRLFADEHVAAVTKDDGLSIADLLEDPSVLIVEVPMHDQKRCRPLVNCLIANLFSVATETALKSPGQRLKHPLRILIDDCPLTTGPIPTFAEYLSLIRSFDIGVVAAMHSKASLEHFFGTEAGLVLSGFNNQIFLSPIEDYDAKHASSKSGSMTAELPESERSSAANSLVHRQLLTPDDISSPFSDPELGTAATFFLGGIPPFQAFLQPSFKSPTFGQLVRDSQRCPAANNRDCSIPKWKPRQDQPKGRSETNPEQLLRKRYANLRTVVSDRSCEEDKNWWSSIEAQNNNDVSVLMLSIQRMVIAEITFGQVRAALTQLGTSSILKAIDHASQSTS